MEKISFSSPEKRIAVVTGGNKGIGLQICRQLALKEIAVILTARDEKRGCEAVESLKASGFSDVMIFHQLDVKDADSIASLADFIKTHFKKLDILVNNAGIGLISDVEAFRAFIRRHGQVSEENLHLFKDVIDQSIERAQDCLNTNYYGTKAVTQALLPFLQLANSARIVNVSSAKGQLKFIPNEKIKEELNFIESLTVERLDELVQLFLKDFEDDKLKENGWPTVGPAYKISKVAMNAYTRILARKFPNMRINCVHPGAVKTDLSLDTGSLTAEQGARAPVMLTLIPNDGPSGCYFDEMKVSTF